MTTVTIPIRKPHSELQRRMVEYDGNVVAFAGRRFGKTDAFVLRLYYKMVKRPGLYWWVGLSWKSASMKRAWRQCYGIARVILKSMGLNERDHINRSSYEIRIPGLGEIWFRSADNPSSLAGEGIHGVILDEFSLMQEIVWTEYIQATLLDYGGWACFGGVPKGNNWASLLWRAAPQKKGWLQVHATSYDNPKQDPTLIDAIRDDPNTPEFFFRQEYLAEIISAEGMVFRRVSEAAVLEPAEFIGGNVYIAGVDVADQMDYTVVSVFNAKTKEQVDVDRFHRVGHLVMEDRLEAIYNRWNMQSMTIESNSIGQSVIDHLSARGMRINPFYTTSSEKQRIIQALQSAFEHGEIKIINDPVQVGELVSYESKRSGSGFTYSAPSGMHDDTVMALAIAWDAINDTRQAVYAPSIFSDYRG